jgi:replicative DNA helicase
MSKWARTGQPCPDQVNCKSSDAYAEDTNGQGFCFSCGSFFKNGVETTPQEDDVDYLYMPVRGINTGTCEFYDMGTKVTMGIMESTRLPYPSGAIKHRSHLYPKSDRRNHMWFSPANGTPELFGQDKFAKGSKASITITEGEYDAASVYQMLKGVTAAVSVKNGSQSTGRDFSAQQEYINSFDRIVLCFDNDKAGQSQLAEAAKFFDFKKVFVVHMSRKDPNAYINGVDGPPDPETFVREWRAAKRYTPDSILSTFSEFEEALAEDPSELLTDFPFENWNEALHGLFATQVVIIKGPEGIGKQLPNTTLIPTPSGFAPLGDLKEGDVIFGRDGKETSITFITETQYGIPCYELEFADGTRQIAGGPHKWGVYDTQGRYSVKTTKEILDEGVTRGDGIALYSVPIADPVEYEKKELSIDPYQLGYWLGDGHSYSRGITVGKQDIEEIKTIVSVIREIKDKAGNSVVYFDDITQSKLNTLGVLTNKHIPQEYLTASVEQRMELLRGLMDSDGSVAGTGCEFYSSNLHLKDDFLKLVRGLGYKARERSKTPTLNGKPCKEAHTIWFLAHGDREIFKLSRKQSKVIRCNTRRATHKTIRSITPVDSVPSRCLTVDNKDHLFLCGEHFTVTHNTEIFRAIEYHILKNQKFPIGIVHMEESNATTLRGIATYELRQPVNDDSVVISDKEIMDAVKKALNEDSSRLMIHSSKDVEDEDLFLDSLRYMLAVGGCRVIFFDHITWLATGNMEDDERKLLDKISQEVKKLALQHNAAIVMISHVNDDGKTRGSRNITKVADIVINLHRDKEATDADSRNTLWFSAEKSRKQGTTTGPLGSATYDRYTGILKENLPEGTPDSYV